MKAPILLSLLSIISVNSNHIDEKSLNKFNPADYEYVNENILKDR